MNKISLIKQLSVALLAIVLISSCKKEDSVTVTRALIDDWSLTKMSMDNGDGMLDTAEINTAFDMNNIEMATLMFGEGGKGMYTPKMYYYSSTFGNGDFTWSSDDKVQEITVTNNRGEMKTTKIIFQDYDHIAILEQNDFFGYGQGVWNFYSRK